MSNHPKGILIKQIQSSDFMFTQLENLLIRGWKGILKLIFNLRVYHLIIIICKTIEIYVIFRVYFKKPSC